MTHTQQISDLAIEAKEFGDVTGASVAYLAGVLDTHAEVMQQLIENVHKLAKAQTELTQVVQSLNGRS